MEGNLETQSPFQLALTNNITCDLNDIVALGVEGIHRIEKLQLQKQDGKTEKYFVLKRIFVTSNTTLYVPIKRCKQQGLRKITSRKIFRETIKFVNQIYSNNFQHLSPRKLLDICARNIKEDGLNGLLNSYISIRSYIDVMSLKDKAVVPFSERIENALIEEIAVIEKLSLIEAKKQLIQIADKFLF